MNARQKLVELLDQFVYDDLYGNNEIAEKLISNGVTVQGSKVFEIGQFKLPIADAILVLKEEHEHRADGYATHLSYGGNGDPAEEVYLDALEMAIAALEWQNMTLSQPPKGE